MHRPPRHEDDRARPRTTCSGGGRSATSSASGNATAAMCGRHMFFSNTSSTSSGTSQASTIHTSRVAVATGVGSPRRGGVANASGDEAEHDRDEQREVAARQRRDQLVELLPDGLEPGSLRCDT